MSILQYFKLASAKSNATNSDQLPDPNGSLSSSVPPKAIELANAKDTKVKDGTSRGVDRGSSQPLARKSVLLQRTDQTKWLGIHDILAP